MITAGMLAHPIFLHCGLNFFFDVGMGVGPKGFDVAADSTLRYTLPGPVGHNMMTLALALAWRGHCSGVTALI